MPTRSDKGIRIDYTFYTYLITLKAIPLYTKPYTIIK